ncbi:ABC transporter permease [Rossellomorea vietnamensis]|uniref:ABC transporter permease n=1 Tax=Rossellomorea vietnamensis TaxID=218284 RepID=A0ACD4C988_9BACI|nr:ABC transporter permease [Rossellomorea vietnamensis]UXH45185.1 ABC transporter permease [Rossellomorea vietnamensis]WQI96540.1 ABC transporter permease [Rossellomorea vietnamensis]
MNVYVREMRAHRKSLIIWCIGMIGLIGSGMGKYAGFSSSGQSMNELVGGLPKSMQAILGIGSLDMSTASGYYGVLFLYIVLLATIHAALTGATIISKEERDKTAEFLFVKPLTRKKIIGVKLAAAFTQIGVLALITWISSLLIVGHYSDVSVAFDIGVAVVGMIILQVLFLLIGTAVAAYSKKPEKSAAVATGVLLLTFILSFAIDLNGKIEALKYLTPFKYFEAESVMYGGGLGSAYVGISFTLIAILSFATFLFFEKRDLKM